LEVFSISVITVEPVVVKPEAASKQASARESKVPVNKQGRPPKRVALIHPKATMANRPGG
jgi:hypothetical protein